MKITTSKNKTSITIKGKPKNAFSIFTIILFIIMVFLIIAITIGYMGNPVKALGLVFIPIAVCVFLLKIIVWNIFGTETIIITKKEISATFHYKFVYRETSKSYPITNSSLWFQSNESTNLVKYSDISKDNKSTLYKIHLKISNDEFVQSSFSLSQEEAKEVVLALK